MLEHREIAIAVIGLIGVLVTALLSNWDKLFPKKDIVKVAYTGYRPTGQFEREFRYFLEVSGTRSLIESMQQQILQTQKINLLSTYPKDAEDINRQFDTIAKETLRVEDVINALMPVYQKYFTLDEVQELNRFYSTDIMQAMVNRMPLLIQDAAPIQVKLLNDYSERLERSISETRQIE